MSYEATEDWVTVMKKDLDLASFLEEMSAILAKILCVDNLNIQVTLETNLVNGVGINDIELSSIDYVDFLVCVEQEYDIVYDFNTRMHTIRDVYNYINNYRERDVEGTISTILDDEK